MRSVPVATAFGGDVASTISFSGATDLPGSAVTAGSAVASGGRLLGPGTMTGGRGDGVALGTRRSAGPAEVTPSETAVVIGAVAMLAGGTAGIPRSISGRVGA